MTPETLATAVVTVVVSLLGTALFLVGIALFKGGQGGYGHAPFPMVPVPRDNKMIVAGVVAMAIGIGLIAAVTVAFP